MSDKDRSPRQIKKDYERAVRSALGYHASATTRWLIGGVLGVVLIVIVFLPPYLYSGSPAYTAAIDELHKTLTNIDELELAAREDIQPRIKEAQALVSRLRAANEGELGGRSQKDALVATVEDVAAILSSAQATRVELKRDLRSLTARLDESLWTLRRERGHLQDGSYWDRFHAHTGAFFGWLTPYGVVAWLATVYVIFVIPPAQLMKPFAWITDRVRGLWVMGLRLDLSETLIHNDKMEMQYAAEIMNSMISGHYLGASKQYQVDRLFSAVLSNVMPSLNTNCQELKKNDFRATLHVPFYVGREELFQLVNYYDHSAKLKTGIPGCGRVFSIRYGIIGRAWRESMPRYDPCVSVHSEELVKAWGMTSAEAERAGQGRQTMLAIRLLDNSGNVLALIFMDAKAPMLFSADDIRDQDQQNEQADSPDTQLREKYRDIDSEINIQRAREVENLLNEKAQELRDAIRQVRSDVGWDDEGRITIGYR